MLIGYSKVRVRVRLCYSPPSNNIGVEFGPENVLIFAGINELKSCFCGVYYLTVLV